MSKQKRNDETETQNSVVSSASLASNPFSDINTQTLLINLRSATRRLLTNKLLCHSLQNLSLALNRPRMPERKLVRLIEPDNDNHISAAILPVKWKLACALVVEHVAMLAGRLALNAPILCRCVHGVCAMLANAI